MTENWTPPLTFEEKLKQTLVPPGIYIRRLYRRECRKGEKEINLVPYLARKSKISLDIGANKGVYSYALLPHSAAVHAFEPNPKALEVLQRWGLRPGREALTIHALALGNASGEATLRVPRSGKGAGYSNQGSTLREDPGREHGTVNVKTARLDDLKLENIGFMKIDVEGFEQQVLEGAKETLQRERPNLLVEIEEKHTKRKLEDEVAAVCAYGYDCFALVNGALTPFAAIDLEKHHRAPAMRADYVFNFIFLPKAA